MDYWRKHWEKMGISGNVGRPIDYESSIFEDIKKKLDIRPNDHILNIGSGNGFLERSLDDHTIISIDVSRNMLKRSGVVYPILAEAWLLPFRKHTFDCICMYSTLHYLSKGEVEMFFDEVERIIRLGGKCLVGDIPTLQRRYRNPMRKVIYSILKRIPFLHFFHYHGEDELRGLLRRHSLKGVFLLQPDSFPNEQTRVDLLITIQE